MIDVRRAVALAGLLVLVAGCGGDDKPAKPNAQQVAGSAMPVPGTPTARPFGGPPTSAECMAKLKKACYTASMVRKAYGIDTLQQAGTTGKGTTIAVFDMIGSPTAERDLTAFSSAMGLPAPDLTVRQQKLTKGPVAKFDPRNDTMSSAAMETTLDLQAAHAMAPDAKLILEQVNLPAEHWTRWAKPAATVSEPEVMVAETEIVADAVRELVSATAADVISISYGYPELDFGRRDLSALTTFHTVFQQAADKGVTVLASSGDHGAASPLGPGGRRVKTVQWPSSDPSVVAVGGTRLHLDADGVRTAPDTVWDEPGNWAGGGGVSRAFPRPTFQNAVQGVVGNRRGVPDLSLSAASDGGLLIHQSFIPQQAGWFPVGGTSEAAPLLAGVVALADQVAGKRLGFITPAIYRLAAQKNPGIVDITTGQNGVDGYRAAAGYDLASGWGTIDAAKFVPALVNAMR